MQIRYLRKADDSGGGDGTSHPKLVVKMLSKLKQIVNFMCSALLLIYIFSQESQDHYQTDRTYVCIFSRLNHQQQSCQIYLQEGFTSPANLELLICNEYGIFRKVQKHRRGSFFVQGFEFHGRMLANAPTPTSITFGRSADCMSYTFSWSYTLITNPTSDKTYFQYQQCCTGGSNWVIVYSGTSGKFTDTVTVSYSTLTGYGYYFGKTVSAKLGVQAASYSQSSWYTTSSPTNWIQQAPGNPSSAPTAARSGNVVTVTMPFMPSTWTSTSSPTGTGNSPVYYKLEVKLLGGSTWTEVGTQSFNDVNTASVTLPSSLLLYGSTYNFRYWAVNSCGTSNSVSPSSSSFLVTIVAPNLMNPPTLVTAYDSLIKVQWVSITSNSDTGGGTITSYELSYKLSTDSTWVVLEDTLVNTFSQTDPASLTLGWAWSSTYNYRLRAKNSVGYGSYSTVLNVNTPTVPSIITTLQCSSMTILSLTFQWSALTTDAETGRGTITNYELRYRISTSTDDADWVTLTASSGYTSLSYTQTSGFLYATTYHYQIRAENIAGIGSWSANLVVFTPSPTIPVNMAIPIGTTITPTSIVISWTLLTTPQDRGYDTIIDYTLQKSSTTLDSDFTDLCITDSVTSSCSETSGWTINTNYYYRVKAQNSIGYSAAWSPTLEIITDTYPTATNSLSYGTVEPGSMVLSWTAVPTADEGRDPVNFYAVELLDSATNTWNQLNSDYNNVYLTYTHTPASGYFPASTLFDFRVRPKNGVDYSTGYSNVVSVLSDGIPNGMYTLTAGTVTPLTIQINWQELTDASNMNGRDLPTYYMLEWHDTITDSNNPVWTEMTQESDGVKLTYTHTVTSVFPSGSYQKYRVKPKNRIGWGTVYSAEVSIQADEVPIKMSTLTVGTVNPNSIHISWTDITLAAETGRDNIIFYHVKWEETSNSWTDLTQYPTTTTKLLSFTHTLATGVFPSGSSQQYQVCPMNGVGIGNCGFVTATADSVPILANAPVVPNTTITPTSHVITWPFSDASTNGGDPIIFYELSWSQDDLNWVPLNSYTPGVAQASSFTNTPGYIFPSGATVYYRVGAQNGVGMGAISSGTPVLCDSSPTYMSTPQNISVTPTTITITYTALTDPVQTGRDAIIYYSLEFFNRWCYSDPVNYPTCTTTFVEPTDGSWEELTSYSNSGTRLALSRTHTASTLFSANKDFNYRARAKNGVDFGAYSDTISVRTDDFPLAMAAPTLVLVRYNQVQLSWSAVTGHEETGRDTINYYSVWWDQGTGNYVELTTKASQGTTTSYTHSTSQLPLNQNIYYKLAAQNGVGMGSLGTALQVLTPNKPTFMHKPSDTSITPQKIVISWTALDNTTEWEYQGRDVITYYSLECDANTGTFVELNPQPGSLVTSYDHNSGTNPFTPNVAFKYRVRAYNGMGEGAYSDVLSITTDDYPQQVSGLQLVSIDPKNIEIKWSVLTTDTETGRDPITYYKLEYNDNSATGTWNEITAFSSGVVTQFKHTLSSPFPANIDQSDYNVKFRVTAQNNVGFGTSSTEFPVLTRTYPKKMLSVTIDDPTASLITIHWTQLNTSDADTGRDAIINYSLMWNLIQNPLTETWVTINTYPDLGNQKAITSGYAINTNYRVKVAAQNGVGIGIYSDPVEFLTDNTPTRMNTPTEDSSTNANFIKINWDPITDPVDTGRDPVIFYKLEWDQGTGSWTQVSWVTTLVTTCSFSSSIQNGTSYKFRVTPQNGVGFGVTSSELRVVPSSPPSTMNTVQVTLQRADTAVKFNWDYPRDNGDSVKEYMIEIRQSDGTYTQYNTSCNGSDPTIVSQRYCYVEMQVLRNAPYNLQKGNLIRVRAKAGNIKGFSSSYSSSQSGDFSLVVEVEPNVPIKPTEGPATAYNLLHIMWSQIADYTVASGGVTAAIQSYIVQRNEGNNTDGIDLWQTLNGEDPLSLVLEYETGVGIVGGTTYRVRVKAKNKYGWGNWSLVADIRCANPPDATSWITTANSSTNFFIKWSEPFNEGLEILRYYIKIMKKGTGTDMLVDANWYETTDCDGSNLSVNSSQSCFVQMATLRAAPYLYGLNDYIRIRVQAENLEGLGAIQTLSLASHGNNAKVQTPPSAPSVAIQNYPLITNDLQIKISWTVLATIDLQGGIDVTSYEIWWTDSTFEYELLYSDTPPFKLSLLYTKTDPLDTSNLAHPIVPGTQYKLKYKAINIHGDSGWSSETTIIASFKPNKLAAPTTSLTNITLFVTWTVTPNDHARAVSKYSIKFRTSAGVYQEDSSCSGVSQTVIDNLKCSVAMSKFVTSPYNLQIDDLIQVTVEAYNIMGWSDVSDPNIVGVTAKKPPQKAVINLARGDQTGKTQIHLTWTGIYDNVDTGGQPVDYKIFYDKNSNQATWYTLTGSTSNATSYIDNQNFKVGLLYYFKVLPWTDFGGGLFNSTPFGIWAAIVPSGLAAPTTTLNYQTYVEEDDIVIIDWDPPTDNGGLNVWYSIEILAKSGAWTSVSMSTECYELYLTTPYQMPLFSTADAATRCTILVSNLKSKYGFLEGDTIQARITATQQVGSVISAAGGTAVLPIVPCFRTTYPRVFAGSNQDTAITAMDVEDKGHMIVGGYTSDSGLLQKTVADTLPFAAYIAKGNYYAWAKVIETNDNSANTNLYQRVSDVAFRFDGEKAAVALDRNGYDLSYMIVVFNKDGTLVGAFRENTANAKGKISISGMLFDSQGMVSLALDFSPDGTTIKRQAVMVRFNVGSTASSTFNTQFYVIGGSITINVVSQVFALLRIRGDTANFYLSTIISDNTGTKRVILGKSAYFNGALGKYYMYSPSGSYNSDSAVAVIKKMSLYENDLISQHIISACLLSNDGYRIHFGQFVFTGTSGVQTPVVMQVSIFIILSFNRTPNPDTQYNTYQCLGIYQRDLGIAYTLYNDRKDPSVSNYMLYIGKITYASNKMDIISVKNHVGPNNYYGAKFVHMSRVYYWGQSMKILGKSSTYNYAKYAGFLNLYDEMEIPFSCNPTSQVYTYPTTGFIPLVSVSTSVMDWKTSGLISSTSFAATVIKQIRYVNIQSGVYNLNLKEPLTNNTWCPIVSTNTPPTITNPSIPFQLFTYNPDTLTSQTQSFQYNPLIVSKVCPDTVIYNLTYLSDTNQPLPSFIQFVPDNNSYVYQVVSTDNVGTYNMILYSTLGNNMTSFTRFTTQVASPCLNNVVTIPTLSSIPVYDLSNWSPMYIDLNWQVTNNTPSCGAIYFIFKMLNATTLGDITPNIFSIVNQTSGVQRLKIWTQAIPTAKRWNDLMIQARLQGDLVATYTFTIDITNDCGETAITPQIMPNWIYYTGRDSIDLTFVWTETVGKCGPITYAIKEYISANPSSNNSLDATIFTYPSVPLTNNTLKIFTADESKVGTYKIRVYGSLGIGGYKQAETTFTVTIIRDPCAYYSFTVPTVLDLTLWINQTDQNVIIPYFQMSDPSWICNFTYEIRNSLNQQLDPIFKKNEVVKQGTGPNVTLDTIDKTKTDLSPYTIKVKGWPTRQPISVAQTITFRIFIAYLDVTDCPTGKFYNTATSTCQNCQSPCYTCKGAANKCTWCLPEYQFVDDGVSFSCIPKLTNCPAGTIRDPYLAVCKKCPSFCNSCTVQGVCDVCIPGYNLANGNCYPFRDCPAGYKFDSNQCIKCPANCDSCLSQTKCTYCSNNYYLDSSTGLCTKNCPPGLYGDLQSRMCMICQPSCATCVNNNYTCTSCKDLGTPTNPVYYYLFENTCVQRCPYLNHYQNFNNRSCDKCKAECKICVNAINDCIVCSEGSVIAGRECLNSCPDKSYITDIGTCFPCDPSCQKCTGAMNSMCSQCTPGYFLTEKTCEPKCNPPLFPDEPTRTCKQCQYYCNQCTTVSDCQKCKTGYLQKPGDCEGENYLRISPQFTMNVPIDSSYNDFNPVELTSEIWLKIDNVNSILTEIILGTSPYKLRKKSNVAQIQLNYDQVSYCDSYNLKGNQWYHFAYTLSENPQQMYCYINGERISTGITPISLITADILKFKEITFGFSVDAKTSESKFTGYVKEFRWWKIVRTPFQIANFKSISFSKPHPQMVAYWRLNEDRKTQSDFKDSVKLTSFNPAPKLLSDVMEMREIYMKLCQEGEYGDFNDTSGMQECYKCDAQCKNCNGPTQTSCTECVSPYKLIEAEQRCVIVEGCPTGYFEDSNKECQPCHEYCVSCNSNAFDCPKCKPGYFKRYRGTGCVDACPRGLYGNYLTQSCGANPVVTSLYPEDGVTFPYGSFIDLQATFDVLNQEPRHTYTYGWIIKKLESDLDLARDAAKPYYNTDITRVHLDNNIIEPNQYYNITFYVKGYEQYYKGMAGSTFNVIYIGIPPKNGKCTIFPTQGIASVTIFKIITQGWIDIDGIAEYSFFYSFDNGQTYIPIDSPNSRVPGVNVTFDPVFQTQNAMIKCRARSIKGFYAYRETPFVLMKRSTANSKVELAKFDISKATIDSQIVQKQMQLVQIVQNIGQLKEPPKDYFDPKVGADQCTDALCSFAGSCQFDTFTKKYFCNCFEERAGVNCTFKNKTELSYVKNLTYTLARSYAAESLSGRRTFDYEFLNMVTSNIDLMTDDTFDSIFDVVKNQVSRVKSTGFEVSQNKDAEQSLIILSNLLEYLVVDMQSKNRTGAYAKMNDPQGYRDLMQDKVNATMNLVKQIRNSTLSRLSFLQTEINIQTRMISYRQTLSNQEKLLTMPATNNIKKQFSTFVKVSPANFLNTSIQLTKDYIAETVEYAVNPFQLNNTDNVATNVFEVNLYNSNHSIQGNTVEKAEIKGLKTPIELSFPISDNQNLTDFVNIYNKLSRFKHSEIVKRESILNKSGLSCVFWDNALSKWSKDGCQVMSIDYTHIKCSCTHLSVFSIVFSTPKMTIDAPLLENTTVKASSYKSGSLKIEDIVRWPLNKYFANLYELWQHNRPSFLSFLIKPAFPVLVLFWVMYLSSLVYYSGRDDLRRFKMTKQQNRDDLAELNNEQVQNIMSVIRDLIVKDFLNENGKFIAKQSRSSPLSKKRQPPQIKIYEQMSKDEQKRYRKRARRKVFGVPAGLCDRAKRYYDSNMKHNEKNPNAKMSFFNEELKNNLWIGLIAKTSKIAPRHVRLMLMYFYGSMYITMLTIIFAFQIQEKISDNALFQVVTLSLLLLPAVWIITIPVALIFRMPLHLRKMIAGVRTKKVNKAFKEVDAHMGTRYAIGYFICLTMFFLMTLCVIIFNIFYPHDYVMGWTFNIILIYLFDLIVFTFLLAGIQMVNVIISQKIKSWYKVWAAIEVFRYVKNLRG